MILFYSKDLMEINWNIIIKYSFKFFLVMMVLNMVKYAKAL